MKTTLLSPEILEDCLGDESSFHMIKHKRDITLSLSSDDENKQSKYIGNFLLGLFSLIIYAMTH